MKHKITLLFFTLLMLVISSQAQVVRVLYEVVPAADQHVVKVYLQSNLEQAVEVRAMNLSLALPVGVKAEMKSEQFTDSWTNYLRESRTVKDLTLSYGDVAYTERFQYGNADPGLPATGAISVPARSEEPVLVMEIVLSGAGAEQAYLEHQSENAFNQIGGAGMSTLDYEIVHPQRITQGEVLEVIAEHLSVFPNPARNFVSFRIEGALSDNYNYQVMDIQGKVLAAGEVKNEEILMGIDFDLSQFASGAYLVQFADAQGNSLTEKFMKIQ